MVDFNEIASSNGRVSTQVAAIRALLDYSGSEDFDTATLISVADCPACITAAEALHQSGGLLMLSLKVERGDKFALGLLMKARASTFPRIVLFKRTQQVLQLDGLPGDLSHRALLEAVRSALDSGLGRLDG